MAEDPRHPWGTGATSYRWRQDVRSVVQLIAAKFPTARPNTYICHPWCGWARVSVDWWGIGGRGDPIPHDLGVQLRRFAMNIPGKPLIRHTIFEHALWTSWGGYSYWDAQDHSGPLRHVHLTYWK